MQHHDTPPVDVYADPGPDAVTLLVMLEECHLPGRRWPLADAAALPSGFPAALAAAASAALVDHDTGVHVFGSGAALQYLGEKTGKLLPVDPDGKYAALSWLDWQARSLAPAARYLLQAREHPDAGDAEGAIAHARADYEAALDTLDDHLDGVPFVSGEYTIADLAAWGWVARHHTVGVSLEGRSALRRWHDIVAHRTATRRGVSAAEASVGSS
jgi:GSH-dependent disulfide-bond oxidoreductase